jgi:hypothetical protein
MLYVNVYFSQNRASMSFVEWEIYEDFRDLGLGNLVANCPNRLWATVDASYASCVIFNNEQNGIFRFFGVVGISI